MSSTAPLDGRIGALDDAQAIRILTSITQAGSRRGTEAVPEWTPEMGRAMAAELGVEPGGEQAGMGKVARQALLVLAAGDARARAAIERMLDEPAPPGLAMGPVTTTLLITAAVFVLQSHIEFERDKDGKWRFRFKKSAAKDAIVTPLVKKLVSLISGGVK